MISKTVSHYKIIEKLGAGGMGIVYKAKDLKLDRIVALKFLPYSFAFNEKAKNRLIKEAKAASLLQDNYICTIHDIDETDDGQIFIAMDCYEGESLSTKITKEKIDIRDAIEIAIQISRGIYKAHINGIIHRDINPANIFLTTEGIVKIIDFGLAHPIDKSLSVSTVREGTAYYISPEQIKEEKIDERTDIWSFGVTFYQMITGKLPFSNRYRDAVFYSILNESPEQIEVGNDRELAKISQLIFKCLEKRKEDRYQSFKEIIDELENVESGKIEFQSKSSFSKLNFFNPYSLVILFLLLIIIVWFNVDGSLHQENKTGQKNLAVLPFTYIGNDPSGAAFADGLIETLTSQLTQMEKFNNSLKVIPSSELRSKEINSADAASKIFGAEIVITGSIQKAENLVRLALNIIDTKSLEQVNSRVKDYSLKNVYSFQDSVVSSLAGMLELELEPEEIAEINKGGTNKIDAYTFYIQGKGYLQKYWNKENINIALNMFKEAVKVDPDYALAFTGLAEAYVQKFRNTNENIYLDSALYANFKAKEINENLSNVHLTSGIIYSEKGEYKEAVNEFNQAVASDTHNVEACNGLARSYEMLNQFEKAEDIYKKCIRMEPTYWIGYNNLGLFYYSQGKFYLAEEQFKNGLQITPDNVYILNNLGATYFYMERWDETIKIFNEIIKIHPDYSAYSNLGSIYFFQKNDYQKAAQMFKKALDYNNNNYSLWGNLASAYYWNNKDERYKETYKTAITIAREQLTTNPNNPYINSSLASYYASIDSLERAGEFLDKALSLAPDNTDIISEGIETYEIIGNRKKSLNLIKELLKKDYPITKLEKTPGLKNLLRDEKYLSLKKSLNNYRSQK